MVIKVELQRNKTLECINDNLCTIIKILGGYKIDTDKPKIKSNKKVKLKPIIKKRKKAVWSPERREEQRQRLARRRAETKHIVENLNKQLITTESNT